MKKLLNPLNNIQMFVIAIMGTVLLAGGCTDARIASRNLSKASDMFEVDRRIVFYNGINGEYMLTIEGKCSIEPSETKLEVTCKTGADEFKKHYLGLSDNVTYFAEQLDSVSVDTYRYKVIFKPEAIIPDVDLATRD